MGDIEYCEWCGGATERAGAADDSLFIELPLDDESVFETDTYGPLCETCYKRVYPAENRIAELERDQDDWRKGVALVASAAGEKNPPDLSCTRISELILKIRTDAEELEAERDEARAACTAWANQYAYPHYQILDQASTNFLGFKCHACGGEGRERAIITHANDCLSKTAEPIQAELAKLREVVDNYPLLKDGIRAYPGMKVFVPCRLANGNMESGTVFIDTDLSPNTDSEGHECHWEWDEIVSTYEAAESADAEGGG